jgi:acyl-CoA synthetase (AMP-forming)/AMP-acid ligase II
MNADERYGTIPRMAVASGRRFGDRAAIAEVDRRYSFAEVADAMRNFAAVLVARGVRPTERVALWAPNSAAWVVAALGVLAAGGILVPINTRLTSEEAAYIIEKSGAVALIAADEFLGVNYLSRLRSDHPDLEALSNAIEVPVPTSGDAEGWTALLRSGEADYAAQDEVRRRIRMGSCDDESDIIFTSGTTGFPKGVILRHGSSLRAYEVFNHGARVGEGDAALIALPFFHTFGYKAGWMLNLMQGATTVPVAVFDPDAVLECIQREAITHMPGSPTMFIGLLDHPNRGKFDLTSLRQVTVSASTVPVDLIHRLLGELSLDVLGGYGLTESHGIVSLTRRGDAAEVVAETVGAPLEGLDIRIIDDAGKEVDRGNEGELLVRGYTTMSGYHNDPEETARVLRDGWLHTGDVVVLDASGNLRITDRKKDIFIVGGFNVASAEVEKILANLPTISQVAVIGVPDQVMGEVGMAFVVAKAGETLSQEDVVVFGREHLANYKVPRRVQIVSELPLNATGKVLKDRLRELAARTND